MSTIENAILGIVFLALAVFNTILMFKLWGYPFDHEKLKSSAPPRLMLLHHIVGYLFLSIYILMMVQMLPRLWNYQIELPARTVAHLVFGMAIGIILIIKIIIVRFFKYLESTMAPFLGTALLVCTTLLIGLSVPIALKEVMLSKAAIGGTAMSLQNIERVKRLLVESGSIPDESIHDVASRFGLEQGRAVLLNKCVQCHDLRTVLVRPRTPDNWIQTVDRMAERSLFDPISESERWHVSAYLIAVSPDLQRSVQEKRVQESIFVKAKMAAVAMTKPGAASVGRAGKPALNLSEAKNVFEKTCSGCHVLGKVEQKPPRSEQETRELIIKMVDEGLDALPTEIEQIAFYLTATYAKK